MKILLTVFIFFVFLFESFNSLKRSLLNSFSENFTTFLEYNVKNITNLKDQGNLLQIPNSRIVIYVDYTTIFTTEPTSTLIAADTSQLMRVVAATSINSHSDFLGRIVLINNFYIVTITYVNNQNFLTVFFIDLNNEKFIKVAHYPINTDVIYRKCVDTTLETSLHFLENQNKILCLVSCPLYNHSNIYTIKLNINNEFSFSQIPLNLTEIGIDFTSKLIFHPNSQVFPNMNVIVFPSKMTQMKNAPLVSISSLNNTIFYNTGLYLTVFQYDRGIANYCQLASFNVDSMFEDVQFHVDYGLVEDTVYIVWGTPSNNFYFSRISIELNSNSGLINCKISERISIKEPLYSINKIRFNNVLKTLVISDFFSFKSFIFNKLNNTLTKCSEVPTSYHMTRDMLISPSMDFGYSLIISGYNNLNNGLKVLNNGLSQCLGCDSIFNGICLQNFTLVSGIYNFKNYYFDQCPYILYNNTNSMTCEIICPDEKVFDLVNKICLDFCPTDSYKLGQYCLYPLISTSSSFYKLINDSLSLTCGIPSLPNGFVACSNLTCSNDTFLNQFGDKCLPACESKSFLSIENQKYCWNSTNECPKGTVLIKKTDLRICVGCGIGKVLNFTTNQCQLITPQNYVVDNILYENKIDTCSVWVNRSINTNIQSDNFNFSNCEENCPIGQYIDSNKYCISNYSNLNTNGTLECRNGLIRNDATNTCINQLLALQCNRLNNEYIYRGNCLNSNNLPTYNEEYVNYCPKLSVNSGKNCSADCSGVIKGVSCFSPNISYSYGVIVNNQWALFNPYNNNQSQQQNNNTNSNSNNTTTDCSNYFENNGKNCSFPCPFQLSNSSCGNDCPSLLIDENNFCLANITCPLGKSKLTGISIYGRNYTYCVNSCKYQTLNPLLNLTNNANFCVSNCESSYIVETNNQCVIKCPDSSPYMFLNKTNSKVYCRTSCGSMYVDKNNYCVDSCSNNQVFVRINRGFCYNYNGIIINNTNSSSLDNQSIILNNTAIGQTNTTTVNLINQTTSSGINYLNQTNISNSVNQTNIVDKINGLNSSSINSTNLNSSNQTNLTNFTISKRILSVQTNVTITSNFTIASNTTNIAFNSSNVVDNTSLSQNNSQINSTTILPIVGDCYEIKMCADSCSAQTFNSSKYINFNGECIDECPSNTPFYNISSSETRCVEDCNSGIAGENMVCLSSKECPSNSPYYFKINSTNVCVANCSNQTIKSDVIYTLDKLCVSSCNSSILRINNTCVNSCPLKYPYKIVESDSIKYCDESCPDDFPYSDDNLFCNSSCETGLYYFENKCVKTCPKGYNLTLVDGNNICSNGCSKNTSYWDISSQTCVKKCGPQAFVYETNKTCFENCPSSMLIKDNNTCVDSCFGTNESILYLSENLCLSKCLPPNYKSPAGDSSSIAQYSCVSNCTSYAPFYLNDTCYEKCPNGYYANYTNYCVNYCPDYVVEKNCNFTCNDGYINIIGKNKFCVEKCDNYFDLNKQCYKTCPSNLPFISENTTCLSKCPLNQPYVYQDENGKNCVNSCPSNTYLINGTCSTSCPKYFSKDNAGTNVCIPTCSSKVRKVISQINNTSNESITNLECTSSCLSNENEFINLCLNESCPKILLNKILTQTIGNVNYTSSICTNPCNNSTSPYFYVFASNYNYDQKLPSDLQYFEALLTKVNQTLLLTRTNCLSSCPVYSYRNVCLTNCPYGWFVNTKSYECQNQCLGFKSIKNGINFCSDFCDGLIGTDGISCLTTCPDGSFIDITKKKCVASCDLYYNKQCVSVCPTGTFLESTTNKCFDRCPFGMAPIGTNCFSICSDGQFLNRDLKPPSCNPCDSTCSLCTSAKICTKCSGNNYMLTEINQCVKECPEGYYANPDKTLAVCNPCPFSCKSCVNPTLCNYCNNGYNLINKDKISFCNSTCPDGTYADTGICRNCTENCLKCTSQGCSLCKTGMFLDSGNKCVSSCSKGIPLIDKLDLKYKCMPCAEGCGSCDTSQNNCSSCVDNYYLSNDVIFNTKSCVSSCRSGTFPDSVTKSCLPCYISCKTCNGKEKNNCLTCLSSYPTFAEGECLSACKGGQILQSNGKCTNFRDCFSSFILNSTSIHDISSEDFIIGILYKTQSSCVGEDEYMKNFTYKWLNTNGGNISQDGKSLILSKNETLKGQFNFIVNVSYNDFSLITLQKRVVFNSFKILIKIKNENKLQFFNKYPITLDSCLTLDESSTNPNESNLKYTWIVPTEFLNSKKYQNLNNCLISISPEDYAPALLNKNGNNSLDINLEVSKGSRKASKTISVIVDTTPPTSEQLMSINIGQISNKFIVFQFIYADSTSKSNLFKFLWSIDNFTSSQYLNGQTSSSLKIASDDITQNSTYIKLVVTDSSMKTYNLNYTHTKQPPPSDCKCLVYPFTGTFLETEFTFNISDCQTESKSLSYKYYYANKDGNMVSFTQNIFLNTFVSKMVPLSLNNKYTVEITDIQGLSSTFVCPLAVTKKQQDKGLSSTDISNLVGNATDPQEKINKISVVFSNTDSSKLDNSTKSLVVNTLIEAINSNSTAKIDTDQVAFLLPNIIVADDSSTQSKVFSVVSNVISNFDVTKNDPSLVYTALSKLTEKQEDDSKKQADTFIEKINDKIVLGLQPGESSVVSTSTFNIKISKFIPSADGNDDFSVESVDFNSNSTNSLNSTNKVFRIVPTHILYEKRYLQTKNSKTASAGCAMNKNLCVDSKLSDITKGEVSVIAKACTATSTAVPNKSNVKPNSQDTSKIKIVGTKKGRILQEAVTSINYTSVLKINRTNSSDPNLQYTYCATYDDNYNLIPNSCLTWYNFTANRVICKCKHPGLTVNMYDEENSYFSIIYQFPEINIGLINPISIIVISVLSGSLIISLIIAYCKDNSKENEMKKHDNYDIVQQCIIEYTKEGFNNQIGLCSLYCYLLKKIHPVFSLFTTYSPYYDRRIRVLDLFLRLYLVFYFTLMPLYADPVYQSLKNAFARDASKMNQGITDIQITQSNIIWGISFALISGVVTYIIGGIVFFLIFQTINSIEHEKLNQKIFSFMIKVLRKDSKLNWKEKMKKAIIKIRGLTAFRKLLMDIRNGIIKNKEDRNNNNLEQTDSLMNSEEYYETIKNQNNSIELKNNLPKNTQPSNRSDLDLIIDPMNNLNLDQDKEKTFDERVEINNILPFNYKESSLIISSLIVYEYISPIGLTNGSNRTKFYSYLSSERNFMYPSLVELRRNEKIECFNVNITEKMYFTFKEELYSIILYYVRVLLIILIFGFLLYHIAVFLVGIYISYGNNYYIMSIIPASIMIFTNFFIINNLMMFFSTVIMHFCGFYIYKNKGISLMKIVYWILVPSQAYYIHESILTFRDLNTRVLKKNKKI